ncbi:hypothetical protein ACFX5U_09870 [Sphingobacterium sp. SG20118]|uniref:hypothetical protein n=1 Tax=unclassified Sphingobacterium TaxID=2609468 RepID=UPI0004F6DCDF|nr:hypothetical protein [Sphingobacterium sp. ML3W]AIM37131.1 hypothetical protein KO02_10845 [Sphingobacterium sp. ML3W]
MNIQVYLWIVLSSFLSMPAVSQQGTTEESMLRNIVFMRTEGLIMTQFMEKYSKDKKILMLCNSAKDYYEKTQPTLLEVVKGKSLDLDKGQFEQIWKAAQKSFETYDVKNQAIWNSLYEEHVQASIRAYMMLLQEREWPDVTYFALEALPGLINLQEEFTKLKLK